MSKYNWTEDDLRNCLNKLHRLLKKEKDPDRIELINVDINSLNSLLSDEMNKKDNTPKLLELYRWAKEDYHEFEFLKPAFVEFYDVVSKNNGYDEVNFKKISLSKKDILSITHDFYKSLGHYFFSNFMRVFYRRKDHTRFNNSLEDYDYRGATFYVLSLKESFIEINRDFSALDILTSIHEYMHATSAVINPGHMSDEKNIYSEIDPLFIELIAYDYLEDLFNDGTATKLRYLTHLDRVEESYDLQSLFKVMDYEKGLKKEFTTNKELKDAGMECNILDVELENILYYPNVDSEKYVTSYMFAVELYSLYKEDKEKALNYLKQILLMKKMSPEQYYSRIKSLGLYPNNSIRTFHKELIAETNRLVRTKKQD